MLWEPKREEIRSRRTMMGLSMSGLSKKAGLSVPYWIDGRLYSPGMDMARTQCGIRKRWGIDCDWHNGDLSRQWIFWRRTAPQQPATLPRGVHLAADCVTPGRGCAA